MSFRHAPLFVLAVLMLLSPVLHAGQAVVSNVYENLPGGPALNNAPVTLSRIGAEGDFTVGITPSIDGEKLPAQVDVLRRAADGSIRHALVSFALPKLAVGGKVKLDWLNEKAPAPPAFEQAFEGDSLQLKLVLHTAEGGPITSDLGAILGGKWAGSDRVKVLHNGPVMREIEIRDVPVSASGEKDPQIEVFWRLRAFSGSKSIRVSAAVENCKLRPRGRKRIQYRQFKGVALRLGEKVLYEEGPYLHIDQTRYRIGVWTAGRIERIHRRPNYAYWVKGKFMPKYRWTGKSRGMYRNMDAAKVDATFSEKPRGRSVPKRAQGILETGIIYVHMPGGASRWDIGSYPAWAVAYVLSGAPKTYLRTLHADGNGSGAYYMHVRQGGMPGYNVWTVKPQPQDQSNRVSRWEFPEGLKPSHEPDHAHAPSLGYVSYLLTGDKFYADEMSFWASYQAGVYPFKGMRWHQMARAFAWGFRHVVDAAFILPETHPLQAYFTKSVNKALTEMDEQLVKSPKRVHSPPFAIFQSSGRFDWINAKRCSSWMYAWVVWSLGNAADKGFEKAKGPRDWAAEYIVGFYASDDEYKAPDGKTYRFDPKDAMPYSTAVSLWKYKIVEITTRDGRTFTTAKLGKKIKDLDNYGEIWYWTKVNSDNMFSSSMKNPGLKTRPDENGVWPLRTDGWGHGKFNWGNGQKRWWAWHRYGAWVGLVTAVEAGVPKAEKAWKVMTSMAGSSEYGYEMVPRTQGSR